MSTFFITSFKHIYSIKDMRVVYSLFHSKKTPKICLMQCRFNLSAETPKFVPCILNLLPSRKFFIVKLTFLAHNELVWYYFR